MQPILAIGPSNYAGQATAWARAVHKNLAIDAWSFSGYPLRGGGFQFDVDRLMGRFSFRCPLAWQFRAQRLLNEVTHLALDGFKTFARWDRHKLFPQDARRLADSGLQVALIAHGSDVRDPRAHMARDRWSYFEVGSQEWRDNLSRITYENRQFAESFGRPIFYSTPDLAFDLPQGQWLPVVVDVGSWASEHPLLEREKPKVLHVPSQRNPPIKGTQYIDPILRRLHDEGAIEYLAPEGVPHAVLRELVRSSDVVVDQLLFGSYGVAAVEAMAAGRVVVGRMSQCVRDLMPESPTMLEATPETLYELIASVRDRRDELRAQAKAGVAFASRWHDGAESARRLAGYLGS